MASKNIVCKCGKLLGTTSSSSARGTKWCSACKSWVQFAATPTGVETNYK